MQRILLDVSWMFWNIVLALTPIFLGWFMYRSKKRYLEVFFGLLYVLFLPNTIYLLTDIIHFEESLKGAGSPYQLLVVLMYSSLLLGGFITFVAAMYPFEKFLKRILPKKKSLQTNYIITTNFLIGLGLALGRIERINSWDIVIHPIHTAATLITIFTTGTIFLSFIGFGLLTNIVYFGAKIFLRQQATRK